MSWLREAIDAIQLKPRFLFGIFLVCMLLLGLPAAATDVLGVTALRSEIRPWIGIGALAAFSFWVVQLWPIVGKWWHRRRRQKAVIAQLDSLSDDERILLAYCIERNRLTILLSVGTRELNTPSGLCQKGLLS